MSLSHALPVPAARPDDSPGSLTVKLLTLNAHKGFTALNRRMVLPQLRDAVRTVSADVVFLQEVIGTHEGHSRRHSNWPSVSQYEFLADSIWSDYAYGRNAVYPDGDHGNAVLSKFPILDFANHDVSLSGSEQRGMLHCKLKLPGRERVLHVICTHLGLRHRQRQRQLNLLCTLLRERVPPDGPLIVAGDFNDWRQRAHEPLRACADLRETFVERSGEAARTFPARFPLLRLDRIYVRHVTVRHTAVLAQRPWSHLSDHAGLLAEVTI